MKKVLLKDLLFTEQKVMKIANEIHNVYSSFKKDEFVYAVVVKFPELELKQRISWITACLGEYLPDDYPSTCIVLLKALPAPNNPDLSDNDFGDFIYAPYAEYVAKKGCRKEYLRLSFHALSQITQRFSAEDAIRYFINAFPKETLDELMVWTKDKHYHVRRLCSEGTRPKLPWSQKISIPITAPLPILNNLFFDKTRFVTRSVANHMNDISKIDPNIALETLATWKRSRKQKPGEMEYIIKHALRTLVKQGNKEALKMLGYTHAINISIEKFNVPKHVKINTPLIFSFSIKSKEDINVIIDYSIFFQNKTGKMKSKKVFKITKRTLKKNEPFIISKRHMFCDGMTTRTLYPGKHEIALQINGKVYAKKLFELVR